MKKRLIPLAVLAAAMASCSSDDVIEANPDPSGNALTFSIAVGHSRATETTLTNLGNFRIVAKGVHPHGGVYDNFLIDDTDGGEIAKKSTEDGANMWKLDRDVYWPTSMEKALFWAYTCAKNGDADNMILPGATFTFDTDKVKAAGFSPDKAVLTASIPEAGVVADGKDQVDFVTAFTQCDRTINVPLNFEHVLSQINIKAVSKDKVSSDHRIVRIKGAWLVNTKDNADLVSGYEWNKVSETATHDLNWENYAFKSDDNWSAYGSYYTTPRVLDSSTSTLELLDHSLMLIPQTIVKWEGKDNTTNSNNNAFILLLCRVELKHSGKYHDGTTPSKDVAIFGNDHYHQMFPVNASNEFNEEEYGFVCVPVGLTFDMGKRYTFTLDICGKDSSAGIYPPETDGINFETLLPTDKTFTTNWNHQATLSVVNRADGLKGVGVPVLDDPIKFEVSVAPWSDAWTEGSTDGDLEL